MQDTPAAEGRLDPQDPPVKDPNTKRPHFTSYTIVFLEPQEQS